MTIGEQIKHARERQGFGQREYARRIGISEGYLCLIEGGCRLSIGANLLWKLCRGLGLSVDAVLDEAHREPAPPTELETRHATFLRHYADRMAHLRPHIVRDLEALMECVRQDERARLAGASEEAE